VNGVHVEQRSEKETKQCEKIGCSGMVHRRLIHQSSTD